jgi:hypothetical protein
MQDHSQEWSPSGDRSRRAPTRGARAALLVVSLGLSLLLAECGAAALRRGAYPYLNLFVADARYGVRLKADASTRLRSRTGRITEIRTNGLGFRGPEWPPPSGSDSASERPRALLLGDSQMMGYGVQWQDALAPRLGQELKADVLAAAVPSWGPHEYVLATRELVPLHRPRWVLFVANAANDWFEASVPNRRRTTARDGFAATFDGRPAPRASLSHALRAFPGRDFLLGRSHLVLLARELTAGTRRAMGDERPAAPAALRLVRDLPRLRASARPHRSRLTRFLLETAAICREHGCQVVAVALPVDVQVNRAEWAKYRAGSPVDLTATLALLDDFVADARDAGLAAINLLEPLRRETGAFLLDDYHLSPAGHAAAARAVAGPLRSPVAQQTARYPSAEEPHR